MSNMNNGYCNACKQDDQPIAATWITKEVGFEKYNGEGKTTRMCVKCKADLDSTIEEAFKDE